MWLRSNAKRSSKAAALFEWGLGFELKEVSVFALGTTFSSALGLRGPAPSYQFPTRFHLKRANICVFCDFAFMFDLLKYQRNSGLHESRTTGSSPAAPAIFLLGFQEWARVKVLQQAEGSGAF